MDSSKSSELRCLSLYHLSWVPQNLASSEDRANLHVHSDLEAIMIKMRMLINKTHKLNTTALPHSPIVSKPWHGKFTFLFPP